MKKQTFIAACAAVIFFLVVASTFLVPHTTKTVDMDIKVASGKLIGINLDSDAVHFGKVPTSEVTGTKAERNLVVDSGEAKVKVIIRPGGLIGQWVIIEPTEFNLDKHEAMTVNLTAIVPAGTPVGNYTGKLDILFMQRFF